jgi:hypothetical protein
MTKEFTRHLQKLLPDDISVGDARSGRKAANISAIYEPIAQAIRNPQHASNICTTDSYTCFHGLSLMISIALTHTRD